MALPPPDVMYRALSERDATFDGLFVFAVTTTGVFCRPACPARTPKRLNVVFFGGAAEAERHGFRACKRCRPLEAGRPRWVEDLFARLESDPSRALGDEDLARVGTNAVRARRWFKEHFGMTFQAWQRAVRLAHAREEIATGRAAIAAGLASGWGSASGFQDAFRRWFGGSPSNSRRRDVLHVRELPSPIGPMIAAASSKGVVMLEFAARKGMELQIASLRRLLDLPVVIGSNDHLEQLDRELGEYFAGARWEFTVGLAPVGTNFQRAVWRELRWIPYGETRSYWLIANRMSRLNAQRAVGRANGQNRIAIVIPCHRVVRSDGSLSGYAGEPWRKQWLLDHEQRVLAEIDEGAGAGSRLLGVAPRVG